MTLHEANQKITTAVEGVLGRLAIIALLGVIATTSGWMLKTELEQAEQLTSLSRDMINLQSISVTRETHTEAEVSDVHHSLDNINATIVQLEVRFGQLDQRLADIMIPMAPKGGH